LSVKNNQIENTPRVYSAVVTPPITGAGAGAFYPKDVGGIVEGFYVDSNGVEIQITTNGSINVPAAGEINTASNVGIGAGEIFKQKVGSDLEFRKIKAGSNITVAIIGDDIEISTPASVGEANTASNVGTGNQIFKQKVGSDLELRTLKAGTNVTIVSSVDEITISAAGGGGSSLQVQDEGGLIDNAVTTLNFTGAGVTASQTSPGVVQIAVSGGGGSGEINTASNLGAGEGIFALKSGVDLQFKSLVAGTNVSLASDANTITISATGGAGGETNTASNVGTGGVGIFKQKSGVDLEFKNINTTTGLLVSNDVGNDEVDISLDINSLTAEASLDGANDYVLIYDSSASAHKKALLNNLPGGGGGSAIAVEDEGISLTAGVTKFNFVGAGVTATEPVANEITVTIPGGGGGGGSTLGDDFRISLEPAGTLALRIADGSSVIPAGLTLYQGDDPSVDSDLGATANDLVIAHTTNAFPMVATTIAEVGPFFTQAKQIDFSLSSANDKIVSNITKTQFRITNIQNEAATADRLQIYIKLA
jgi:hypothetical protein